MAIIASRRGKLGVYWRDVLGKRHFVVCEDEEQRLEMLARVDATARPEGITLNGYARLWLERVRVRSAKQTYETYARSIRTHVEKADIGRTRLIELRRSHLKDWIAAMMAKASPRTVALRASIVRAMLAEAVEDELIPTNPAASLIKSMRLQIKSRDVEGVDAGDAGRLLQEARDEQEFPGLALMIHTGLRMGEALGLRWSDVNLDAHVAQIVQQMYLTGDVATLKTQKARRVIDLPGSLVDMMRSWRARQLEAALADGEPATEYVLAIEPPDARRGRDRIASALRRSMRRAGIAAHLTPHRLRHGYASLQLSRGRDLVYVQQQLGHASVKLTADLYGCHLRRRDPEAADDLGNVLKAGQMGLWKKSRK